MALDEESAKATRPNKTAMEHAIRSQNIEGFIADDDARSTWQLYVGFPGTNVRFWRKADIGVVLS
jgi:hypothetical protein